MRSLGMLLIISLAVLIAHGSSSGQETEKAKRTTEGDALLVHPAGELEIRQKVVPLQLDLDKVGNAPITSTVRLSPDVQASIERPDADLRTSALRGLASADRSALDRVIRALRTGNQAAAQREWQAMISQANARLDINSLVQHVLRESYTESINDLRSYADKVRFFNDTKEAIRNHLSNVRSLYARWSIQNESNFQRAQPQTISALVIPASARPPYKPQYRKKDLGTQADWNDYISDLEQHLQTAGDDAQLANIDLQNALQKQQQTLQTMSNVSKMLRDTAMAIERKIG